MLLIYQSKVLTEIILFRRHYEAVASLLFRMAVLILVLGPFSLSTVNYGVTFMFIIITLQQLCDIDDSNQVTSERPSEDTENKEDPPRNKRNLESDTKHSETENKNEESNETNTESKGENITESNDNTSDCDTCNENRIYNIFKNLREKFSFNDSLEN